MAESSEIEDMILARAVNRIKVQLKFHIKLLIAECLKSMCQDIEEIQWLNEEQKVHFKEIYSKELKILLEDEETIINESNITYATCTKLLDRRANDLKMEIKRKEIETASVSINNQVIVKHVEGLDSKYE